MQMDQLLILKPTTIIQGCQESRIEHETHATDTDLTLSHHTNLFSS